MRFCSRNLNFLLIEDCETLWYFKGGCGEIGRRTRFRFWRLRACRFKSYHPHHTIKTFFIGLESKIVKLYYRGILLGLEVRCSMPQLAALH